LSGQNFIVNPGFENHLKPLERLQQAPFLKNAEFCQTVQGWKSFSKANMSALFSTKYKATQWQAESLGYNFKKCQPYDGNSMIRLWVNPKGGECGIGSGGYIQSSLTDTLIQPAGAKLTLARWLQPRAEYPRRLCRQRKVGALVQSGIIAC
jgi:hypothetical protein